MSTALDKTMSSRAARVIRPDQDHPISGGNRPELKDDHAQRPASRTDFRRKSTTNGTPRSISRA